MELLKINDTPYIGYFKSGEFKFRYNGKTKSKSIVKFCKELVININTFVFALYKIGKKVFFF